MKVQCDYCQEYKPESEVETFPINAQTDEERSMCSDCSAFAEAQEPEAFDPWEDFDRYFAPQWGNMPERGINES